MLVWLIQGDSIPVGVRQAGHRNQLLVCFGWLSWIYLWMDRRAELKYVLDVVMIFQLW